MSNWASRVVQGYDVVSTDRQGSSRQKSAFSVCLDGADLARIDGSCRQEGRQEKRSSDKTGRHHGRPSLGWWLVRLSTALIDVICLKRGTTFATVLSMLLMRHERQTQPAGDIFEESGRGRWGGWLPPKWPLRPGCTGTASAGMRS